MAVILALAAATLAIVLASSGGKKKKRPGELPPPPVGPPPGMDPVNLPDEYAAHYGMMIYAPNAYTCGEMHAFANMLDYDGFGYEASQIRQAADTCFGNPEACGWTQENMECEDPGAFYSDTPGIEPPVPGDMPPGQPPIVPVDWPGSQPPTPDTGSQFYQYTIQEGDTLSGLAQRFTGNFRRWEELIPINPQHPEHPKWGLEVYVGDVINMPLDWVGGQADPLAV